MPAKGKQGFDGDGGRDRFVEVTVGRCNELYLTGLFFQQIFGGPERCGYLFSIQ